MQRRVEQRERRAFAGAVERTAARHGMPPFNVGGRQRTQRPGDFLDTEVRQMAGFELRKPPFESRGQMEI